jgi:Raf kinase inhibitor-like YbhB/YbcL family protein
MKITSPAFAHNAIIPTKYTCQGQDISPPLTISDIPEGTISLALINDDPDAPMETWDHWLIWNIKPTGEIKEDSAPGTQGKNSWGRNDYGGPCPPSGTHRYFFKLYALDSELDLPKGATKAELEEGMEGHILEQAELIGLYKKS